MKNLLIATAWLLLPVYASTPLFGSASAVVENRKDTLVYADPIDEPVLDEELTSTLYSEGTLLMDEMDPTSDEMIEPDLIETDPIEPTTEEAEKVVEEQLYG